MVRDILKNGCIALAILIIAHSYSIASDVRYEWQIPEGNVTILFDMENNGKTLKDLGIAIPKDIPPPIYPGCVLNLKVPGIMGTGCLIANWHTKGYTPNVHYQGPAFYIPEYSYGTPAFTAKRVPQYWEMLSEAKKISPYKPPLLGEIVTPQEVYIEAGDNGNLGKVITNSVKINRISKNNCEQFIDITPNSGVVNANTDIKVSAKNSIPTGRTTCEVQIFWSPDGE